MKYGWSALAKRLNPIRGIVAIIAAQAENETQRVFLGLSSAQ